MDSCSCCGSYIPEGQGVCSMCYGDPSFGSDGYYEHWLEEQEWEDQMEQAQYEEYLMETYQTCLEMDSEGFAKEVEEKMKEGQKVQKISTTRGSFEVGEEYYVAHVKRTVAEINMIYHNGQMAMVPWYDVVDENGETIFEVNDALVVSVAYAQVSPAPREDGIPF